MNILPVPIGTHTKMIYFNWWLVILSLAYFSLAHGQNETELSRMGNIGSVPYTGMQALYPQGMPQQFKPLESQAMGHRLVGDWTHRHNLLPFDRLSPPSPILPMALSFSIGYVLFRLLAMGVILLEKGAFPSSPLGLPSLLSELSMPYGHWKMDTKLGTTHFGRSELSNEQLRKLTERVHQAFYKHEHVNKH